MTRPTYEIILDFDDVIYPLCDGIMAVLAEEGITGKITQWEMHRDFGMTKDDFWSMIYQPQHEEALFLQPIGYELLAQIRRLKYAGHRLHLVTARATPQSQAYCREVVMREKIPFDTVTFAHDKGPVVDELNASFSLDDGVHNYMALDQVNHLTYLMDMPHNRHFEGEIDGQPIRRINSMEHFTNTVIAFTDAGVQLRGDEA